MVSTPRYINRTFSAFATAALLYLMTQPTAAQQAAPAQGFAKVNIIAGQSTVLNTDFDVTRMDCTQEGGCTRSRESSAVAFEESECIRASSCDDIVARKVCERLDARVIEAAEGGGPNVNELYQMDWLCD